MECTEADIRWNCRMEDCPTDKTVLVGYDDGDLRLIEEEDNDTAWSLHFPIKKKQPGVSYPEKWARVA